MRRKADFSSKLTYSVTIQTQWSVVQTPRPDRRPKIIYWTTTQGIICSAESRNTDALGESDHVFDAPFSSNAIIGRNLFNFFAGDEVSHLYQALATKVATTGQAISFNYRCDGPQVRRDMHMKLSREDQLIRYESTVIRETVRSRAIPEETPGAQTFVAICSFCKNYRFPVTSTEWKDIQELLTERDLPTHFKFTHSLCKNCYTTSSFYPALF